MFYYTVHHIFYYLRTKKQKVVSQRDHTLTFVIGSLAWWLLAGFLWNPSFQHIVTNSFFFYTLQTFFQWAIFIDLAAITLLPKVEPSTYDEGSDDPAVANIESYPISSSDQSGPLRTTIIEESSSYLHQDPSPTSSEEVTQDVVEEEIKKNI